MNINNKKPAKSILANCRTALIALVCATTLSGCGWLKGDKDALAPDLQVIQGLGCLVHDEFNRLAMEDKKMIPKSLPMNFINNNTYEFGIHKTTESFSSAETLYTNDDVLNNLLDLRNRCNERVASIDPSQFGNFSAYKATLAIVKPKQPTPENIVDKFCGLSKSDIQQKYNNIINKHGDTLMEYAAELACDQPGKFKDAVESKGNEASERVEFGVFEKLGEQKKQFR